MAKENKLMPYIIFGVPIAIGLYFIVKSLRKPKGQDAQALPPDANSGVEPTQSGGGTPTIAKFFPMRRGSKGAKVKELQDAILSYDATLLPKFGADSDFGSETEAAVQKLLNKKSVDSQEDINKILGLKQTQQAAQALAQANANRKALATKLLDMKNNRLNWRAIYDTQVTESDLTSDGRVVNSKIFVYRKNDAIPNGSKNMGIVDSAGFITWSVDGKKQYKFSPYGFEVK